MRVINAVLFGLFYVVVVGSMNPVDWLVGLSLGALLPRAAARPRRLRNLVDMPRYVLGVTLAVASGGATMLPVLAGGVRRRRTHEVVQPFGEMTETGAAALAFAISISPGTAVSGFDDAGRRLRINAIDARDRDAVRTWADDFYQRYQRHIFH